MDNLTQFGFNDNTKILLAALIGLQLLHLFNRSDSIVHPILLSNQSEPSAVRNQNQSAIYRNSSIGQLPLVERPAAKARGVADLIELGNPNAKIVVQGITFTVSELIRKSVNSISILDKHTTLRSSQNSAILIASQDTLTAILLDLGAILIGLKTIHISPNDNINTALSALERKGAEISAIVTDENIGTLPAHFSGLLCAFTKKIPPNFGLNFIKLDLDQVVTPLSVEKINREPPTTISYVLSGDEIYSMDNKNVTAGVYSLLSIIPFAKKPMESDTIVTDEPLSSALGRSLLYTAIYSGCSYFCLPENSALPLSPVPQYLFVSGTHLMLLAHDLTSIAVNKWWYRFSRRHALAADASGVIPSPSSWGVFSSVRNAIGLSNGLKFIVSTDSLLSDSTAADLRVSLSVPVVKALKNPRCSSFAFARIPYDTLQNGGCGPPTTAIEVRLDGGHEDEFSGRLNFRGPCVLEGEGDQFTQAANSPVMRILESGSFDIKN
ncbi:hypothetical protein E3P84_03366 [Wallemia ichthyophaga]|nr:hypothetical protein E3P84_03366 [Wallemia ichthyophaga]TIB39807.1 hypothetical protein E3P83_03266 [Wallemia ichthyophaga]